MSEVPLGQREGARLEFKQADVLGKPESVAREVVAMLNAEGGDVWVGLEEDNGYAVRVTPVRDAARERGRLLDRLVDTIEPTPSASDVTVEVVAHEAGDLLAVHVQPGARAPYAQLEGDARRYVKRVDDRLRPMSRDELRELFVADRKQDDALDIARRSLREERDRRQAEKRPGLWLAISLASVELSLDLESDKLIELLVNPSVSGNRDDGWACVGRWAEPALRAGALVLDAGGVFQTSIYEGGAVQLELTLDRLWSQRERGAIWPFALLESVVSAFRLASALYKSEGVPPSEIVLADFGIFGLRGWILRPYSPDALDHRFGGRAGAIEPYQGDDVLLTKLVEYACSELLENPDGAAWPIVEHVYRSFGYGRPAIPLEFAPQTRRLTLGR